MRQIVKSTKQKKNKSAVPLQLHPKARLNLLPKITGGALQASPWGTCRWVCHLSAWRRTDAPSTSGQSNAVRAGVAGAWQTWMEEGPSFSRTAVFKCVWLVCVSVSECTCTWVCACVCFWVYVHACLCVRLCVCFWVYVHACLCVRLCVCFWVYVRACVLQRMHPFYLQGAAWLR